MALSANSIQKINKILTSVKLETLDINLPIAIKQLTIFYQINDFLNWYLKQINKDIEKYYYYSEKSFYKKIIILESFIESALKTNKEIESENIKNILLLRTKYIKFLKDYHLNINNEIINKLDNIFKLVSKNNPLNMEEYLTTKLENDNLQLEIKNLQEKIDDLTNKNEKLQTKLVKDKNNINQLKQFRDKINYYQQRLNRLLKKNNRQVKVINLLQEENSEYNSIIVNNQKLEKNKKIIEALIINKLANEDLSLKELKNLLAKYGFYFDEKIIYQIIKNINNQNINEYLNGKELFFSLEKAIINQNQIYELNLNTKEYNFLVTSDYHFKLLLKQDNIIQEFAKLSEYCLQNNIDYLINLGDLFTAKKNYLKKIHFSKDLTSLQEVLNDNIDFFDEGIPNIPGVNQLILGGNHDENILDSKIDCLKILCDKRYDLNLLGYYHAFLKIGDSKIALHHPNQRFGTTDAIITCNLKQYLNNYYERINIKEKAISLNLLGHTHLYKYYPHDNSIFIPSFLQDREQNGAVQLKIYFQNNVIQEIEIIPLINTKEKLVKKNQVLVKKI